MGNRDAEAKEKGAATLQTTGVQWKRNMLGRMQLDLPEGILPHGATRMYVTPVQRAGRRTGWAVSYMREGIGETLLDTAVSRFSEESAAMGYAARWLEPHGIRVEAPE